MVTLVLVLLTVFAWRAPTSWLGRLMGGAVADALGWLGTVRPLTIICFVVLVGAFAALIAFARFEGLVMAALAAPESLTWFLAIDIGAAVEVLALAWLAASRTRFRQVAAVVQSVRRALGRFVRVRFRRKVRRPPRRRGPANDDEPDGALAEPVFAVAA